jgi:hypothetical protein
VTREATYTCTITVKINTVAQRAGIANVLGRGMVYAWPIRGMSHVDSMTGFATCSIHAVNSDIESGVTASCTALSMAGLASCQVLLCIWSVVLSAQITVLIIDGMRDKSWTVSVAAQAVDACGETAGGRFASLQITSVTAGTAYGAIRSTIGTMVSVSVGPLLWMC